ncbi:MAG: HupE/UreJ family protein [bacterium]
MVNNKLTHTPTVIGITAIILSLLIPEAALAHNMTGHGFFAGFYHPIGGLDHLLAMLSVGMLSTQIGGKHIWSVPATFVVIMLVGGYIGFIGLSLPDTFIEHGIMLSVVLLGLVIATGGQLSMILIYGFVAFFGFCHGYAHGVEMPVQAKATYFAAGFVLSTIIIHLIGVLVGVAYHALSQHGKTLLRYKGAVLMGMGLQMLLSHHLG